MAICLLAACAAPPATAPPPPAAPPVPPEQAAYQAARSLAQERPDRAVAAYETFLSRFPDSPRAPGIWMALGRRLQQDGAMRRARNAYRQVIAARPESPQAAAAMIEILATFHSEGDFASLLAQGERLPLAALDPIQRRRALEMRLDALLATDRFADAAYTAASVWQQATETQRPALVAKLRLALTRVTPEALASILARPLPDEARRLLARLGEDLVFDRHLIGCILPLTGAYAAYGQRALQGIEAAVSRFSQRPQAPMIRLRIEDSRSEAARAAPAVDALGAMRVAAIIGPMAAAAPAATEAQVRGIPIVTLTQREAVPTIGDFVFRHFLTPEMQTEALVRWAVERQAMTRFAVLYPDERYGRTFMNHFWDATLAHGGEVVGVEAYDPEQTDFADPVKKLVGLYYSIPADLREALEAVRGPRQGPVPRPTGRPTGWDPAMVTGRSLRYVDPTDPAPAVGRSHPEDEGPEPIVDFDALFVPDAPSKAGLIIPQIVFHDVADVVFMGTNLWHQPAMIEMTDTFAEGAVFPTGFFDAGAGSAQTEFADAFEAVYGHRPGFIEAVAYDTAMLLFEQLERPQVRSRSALRTALIEGGIHPMLTGDTVFDAGGEAHKALALVGIHRGRFVSRGTMPLEPAQADAVPPPSP